MRHYHIRWADAKLDWQRFQTVEEAHSEGERLKRPDEKYVILEGDGDCERCRAIKLKYDQMISADSTVPTRQVPI